MVRTSEFKGGGVETTPRNRKYTMPRRWSAVLESSNEPSGESVTWLLFSATRWFR